MNRLRIAIAAARTATLSAIVGLTLPAAALGAELLGTAIDAKPVATGVTDGVTVTVLAGTELFEGQVLTTGPEGEIQIAFTDGTLMAIGANATLIVERYLLRGDGTVQEFAVNALGGTFRFLTGSSPSAAYSIATPTGTLGVRGTGFDFWFNPETRNMGIMLYSGAVELCAIDGPCLPLDQRCDVGIVGPAGPPALPPDAAARETAIRTNFPYVIVQDGLAETLRIANADTCLTMASPRTQAAPG